MLSRKIIAIVVVAIAAVAIGGGAAYSASKPATGAAKANAPVHRVTGFGCKTQVTDFATGGGLTFGTNTPTTFATLPITVKGHVNTCVMAHLTVQGYAPTNVQLLMAHALLDGGNSVSGDIQIVGDDEPSAFSDSYSYDFVFPSVPPGAHTVVFQAWSFSTGNNVFINDFTASVEHK
jgi:hypothetical protein